MNNKDTKNTKRRLKHAAKSAGEVLHSQKKITSAIAGLRNASMNRFVVFVASRFNFILFLRPAAGMALSRGAATIFNHEVHQDARDWQ